MTNQLTTGFLQDAQETFTHGPFTILIVADNNPQSPREWDNLGTIATWHRRYDLGDEQPKDDSVSDWKAEKISDQLGIYVEEWDESRIYGEFNRHFISLPVYLYDHSGLTIAVNPFHCPWDSGRLGDIYVSLKKVREEFGVKHITHKVRERVLDVLKSEIKTYDDYLSGDVVGCVIQDGEGGIVESVWGFYPDNSQPFPQRFRYVIEEARSNADGSVFHHFSKNQSGEHDTVFI